MPARLCKATNITLQGTSGGNDKITLNGLITGLGGGNATSVTLNAFGTGNIIDSTQGAPTIATTTLVLSAQTGTIGAANAIQTNATTLSTNSNGTVVAVNDISNGAVAVGASSSGGSFTLTAPNATALNVSGGVTATGATTLSTSGNLSVNAAT